MTRLILLAVVCLSIGSNVAADDEKVNFPGTPPRLVTVDSVDLQKGECVVTNVTVKFVWMSVQRKVERDGKTETVTQRIRQPVYETQVRTIPMNSADVFDAAGRKLVGDEAWKRIVVRSTVAISADGKIVDPDFLAALSKDTVVIVSPEYAVSTTSQPPVGEGAGNAEVTPAKR